MLSTKLAEYEELLEKNFDDKNLLTEKEIECENLKEQLTHMNASFQKMLERLDEITQDRDTLRENHMVELAEAEKRLAKARELQKYRGESHSADRNELESFKRLVAELNLKLACNRAKVDQLEFEIGNYKDRIASYKRRYASASSFSSLEGGGEELEEDRNEGHGEQHLGDDDCPGGRSLGDQAGGDNQHEHKQASKSERRRSRGRKRSSYERRGEAPSLSTPPRGGMYAGKRNKHSRRSLTPHHHQSKKRGDNTKEGEDQWAPHSFTSRLLREKKSNASGVAQLAYYLYGLQ